MYGLEVWMPKVGDVRLVVSREMDGFLFYVNSRLDLTENRRLKPTE